MRLTDLRPKFVTLPTWASSEPFYVGMTWECPHCQTQRLGALFDVPIDPNDVMGRFGFGPQFQQWLTSMSMLKWHREGDTFETMTLSPSVDASGFEGHWHGHIINGEIR